MILARQTYSLRQKIEVGIANSAPDTWSGFRLRCTRAALTESRSRAFYPRLIKNYIFTPSSCAPISSLQLTVPFSFTAS
jgi:hypothetical protein